MNMAILTRWQSRSTKKSRRCSRKWSHWPSKSSSISGPCRLQVLLCLRMWNMTNGRTLNTTSHCIRALTWEIRTRSTALWGRSGRAAKWSRLLTSVTNFTALSDRPPARMSTFSSMIRAQNLRRWDSGMIFQKWQACAAVIISCWVAKNQSQPGDDTDWDRY